MKIRILLADDHKLFAAGIRSLLDSEREMEVVGEARDGAGALELARVAKPDIVLMDLMMPDMDGIEATRRISSECPASKVLCLSMHNEREFVDAALRAGAAGYILKDGAVSDLLNAIRIVAEGRAYLSPDIAVSIVERYRVGEHAALTAREREVLRHIAEGLATKEIAARLELSVKTISTHRENLMQKLGIRSVAGLTKHAIREGLTSVVPPGRKVPSRSDPRAASGAGG